MGFRYKVTFQPLITDRRDSAFDGFFELTDALHDAGFQIEDGTQTDVKYDYNRCSARWFISTKNPDGKARLREIFKRFDIYSVRITEIYF